MDATTLSILAQLQSAGIRLDAANTLLFEKALEHVKNKVFETKFAELKSARFVPFSTEAGPLAQTVTYRVFDSYVQATVATRMMTQIPIVNASARKYTVDFKSIMAGYEYSYDDERIAAATGSDLIARLAMAAKKAIELALDEILAIGNPETGMTGLANHPNVDVGAVPNGSWTSTTAVDDMLEDLVYMDTFVPKATNKVIEAKTLLLPYDAFALANGTFVGQEKSSTVLKTFLAQAQHVREIDWWGRLDTASPSGGKRAMVYDRNPEYLEAEIGVLLEQLPPKQELMGTTVPMRAKVAGVTFHHPKSAGAFDNLIA